MTRKKTARPSRTPGRPRSLRTRRGVLDAARALFEEGGYAGATIEAIAARSGIAKTTIYRRWSNRASLLVDLLVEVAVEEAPPPTAGDPLTAIRTELRQGAAAADGLLGRLMTSLLGEAQRDAEVRAAMLDGLIYPRREATVGAIRRAQEIGELRSDVDPFLASDLLFGPLFYRMLVRHAPLTEEFIDEVVRCFLEGMRARPDAVGTL
jgi:AcrR family transcriptional regulator